ncbi:acyl-CoA dehydrogenase N-terminal domain-containing protein [Pseudomonas sp. MAP12]|uniref:Acyl-CoA dehydrogenase N-terminal domain-containing protein n=1 Tax=Geopseudomonas aromaticivorans TaxID=2849492 RepID=A0ABS6N3G7_9GAMM|nr:acyl-CoA dehydrogenase N-terminal domain-containing protein [Pseudomonas aromaticivorans]MBV2135161.1 acyl-CoA dehydrogenase N-terminal domain-containing protein [Pseudomonas aromaticivorans]
MPAYQAPLRDLRFVSREPFDLSGLTEPQACEAAALEPLDTLVEAGTIFCVTHAWGLYPVSTPSSESLKQFPAV